MTFISSFVYNQDLYDLRNHQYGNDWPVVYFLENGKEAYIGQTVNVYRRGKEHQKTEDRQRLKKIHIITDSEFNMSASLDIESWLIQYLSAEQKYTLQNGNGGLRNHSYFDRERYKAKFEVIWEELREKKMVDRTLLDVKNSDIFKYSPYKALSLDQLNTVENIFENIQKRNHGMQMVNGKPGTGKTVLATFLIKYLAEHEETKSLKVGLVVPMTSLRKTLKKVFKNISGLNSNMVIGPSDVVKQEYDVLIVDEAHRLKKRKNITNYKSFDDINKKLELGDTGTELDWITMNSKHQVLFYDSNQSVKPSDIDPHKFEEVASDEYTLMQQLRIEGGENYIHFVTEAFDNPKAEKTTFSSYDFQVFDDLEEMVNSIKEKDEEHGLSRMVAGYAWEWRSKTDPNAKDIKIGSVELKWNSTNTDWVNSQNARNEVGCIHTVQGYDLNYVGVIIGPELSYDPEKQVFVFNREKYKDQNGHRGVNDDEEIKRYVLNIYKTLLTRGIKGTYVFATDKHLNDYLKNKIGKFR